MNGKWRFSPQITAGVVLAWIVGLTLLFFLGPYPLPQSVQDAWLCKQLGIRAIGFGQQGMFLAGTHLFLDSLRFVTLPPISRLVDLAAAALLLGSAWCIGLGALRLMKWAARFDVLTHLFAIAMGLGIWAWFILIAGMLGFISPTLYLAASLLSLLLLAWHWRPLAQQGGQFRAASREGFKPFEVFLIVCLVAGAVLHIIPAFAPEIEYDALEYHLGALKEYQKAGRIYFLEYNFYASMPSLTEMLYLWGVVLRSSAVAKLLHGAFGLLTAVGLIAFGKRLGNRPLGLTAAALYYCLPFVTNLAETARIDLATTFFAFLAGAALHRFLFDEDRQSLWLCALTVGLAMATKYTAGPVVFLPLLGVLVVHKREALRSLRTLALFLGLTLLPVLPWLVKNWVFTGNPVYPIANGIFQSPFWDDVCEARFHRHHAPTFHTFSAWAGLVISPVVNSMDVSFASPILLLFAPLFLLVAKPGPRWKCCAWFAQLIYIGWWAFTFRPWRFLFPALPWFALLGAIAIVCFERDRATMLITRAALAILLAYNLTFSFVINALDPTNPDRRPETSQLAVFFGRVSASDYLSNVYSTLGLMNRHLPPDSVILFVGEARIYYTVHRVLANTVYDRSIIGEMVARSKTPGDLLREMNTRGVTHIYVRQDELDRLRQNYGYLKDMNWPLFRDFLKQHARPVYQKESHAVYEIVRTDQSPPGPSVPDGPPHNPTQPRP